MSVVNLGPIVFLFPFSPENWIWEIYVQSQLVFCLFAFFYAKKSTFFFGLSKIPHIKVGNVSLKKNRQFFFRYLISVKFTTFIDFPKWRTRWSLLVKEKKVLTWTVIFCLTDKEVSVIRPRSKLFANWYHRLLALISWSRKILAPVINGLSDTIYRIINIAPCLRHWIGIESVIDIPSFLVVISQCKWNKIITACKKRPKQPYQVCVLSSKYIRDW